jgi:hypothetical protein
MGGFWYDTLELDFNKVLMFGLGFNNRHNTLWGKLYTAGDIKIEWHGALIYYIVQKC